MKHPFRTLSAGAVLFSLAVSGAANAAISVTLDGQPLATSVAPVQIGGRTLVPMRDIFEALGAQLQWNAASQTITAQKDATNIVLGINNRNALVNGQQVQLDQPPMLLGGRTFVPLRFVSEALNAQVGWNNAMQVVSIQRPMMAQLPEPSYQTPTYQAPTTPPAYAYTPPVTNSTTDPNSPFYIAPAPAPIPDLKQVAGYRTISIPTDVVIPVKTDTAISSATARVGQRFTASVASRKLGDSEFPPGTKLEAIVVEARPQENNQPGVLDFNFTNAILPDGTRVALQGDLVSLDESNVAMDDGRIVAKGAKSDNKLKIIGIGAGAGYVLGRVLKTNSTLTTILGAAGGYLVGKSRDKRAEEANVPMNASFGVRLNQPVRYTDNQNYAEPRARFLRVSSDDLGDTNWNTNRPNRNRNRNNPNRNNANNQPDYDVNNSYGNYDPNYYDFNASTAGAANTQYNGYNAYSQLPVDIGNVGGNVYPNDPNYNPNLNQFPNTQNDNRNVAGYRTISIPEGAVVPITLNTELSSATARVGQVFGATVVSTKMGDSEFPTGTKIRGVVTEVQKMANGEPGVLDLEFRSAKLPDGTFVQFTGELIALDDKSVSVSEGRITAKTKSNSKLKVIGIGAAAGFVVGRLLKKDGVLPALLGALGGYLYGQSKNDKPAEAYLAANTKLGVRLNAPVRYTDSTGYYNYRANYLR